MDSGTLDAMASTLGEITELKPAIGPTRSR
jgi:hypothetical protein